MPTAVCMSIKVDAVHFRLSKKKIKLFTAKTKLKAKIGEYRKETPLSSTIHETTPLIRTHEYDLIPTQTSIETLGQWDVKTIGRQGLENHPNGCLIHGDAGTGKSVILMQIYEELKKGKKGVALLAPTNIAAVRIKGQTIHKFLRCNNDGSSLHVDHLMNIIRKYKYILIDEISMVNTQLYEYLALLRSQGIIFYISGDFKQIRPVKEEHIDFENSIVLNDLTPDRIQLTHNYRANQAFADACALQNYEELRRDMNMFRSSVQSSNASYDKLNICYTHEMRNKINAKCEKIYGKLGELGSYIIMKESTRTIGKNLIPKNIIFEVTGPREVTQRFTDEETKFTFTKDEFKDLISTCELAYAVTCHSIQGATIKTPYTIHQYDIFNKNMIYTALTRTTDPNNVRILP